MPSFKAQIRPYKKRDSKTNIKIRISHNGKVRYIKTCYDIEPKFFDNNSGRVKNKYANASYLNSELRKLEIKYERRALQLSERIFTLDINNLVKYLKIEGEGLNFFEYSVVYLKEHEKIHSFKYRESAENTLNNVRKFSGDLCFQDITVGWLARYQNYFKERRLSQNSIAIDLTNIRTIFNHAINNNFVSLELYPFRKFRIKRVETPHRDLSIEDFRKLIRTQNVTTDIFLLSFYLIGINYKDLLFASCEQVYNNRLNYMRSKTKRSYSVFIQPEAWIIINRYKGAVYLINLIEGKNSQRKTSFHSDIIRRHNRALKNIAKQLKINVPLSTYYARHSWATFASQIGISRDIIRLALGHSEKTVTDIYIRDDIRKVDEANRRVLDYVNAP